MFHYYCHIVMTKVLCSQIQQAFFEPFCQRENGILDNDICNFPGYCTSHSYAMASTVLRVSLVGL